MNFTEALNEAKKASDLRHEKLKERVALVVIQLNANSERLLAEARRLPEAAARVALRDAAFMRAEAADLFQAIQNH
jgi:hypothetical protein